MRKFLLIAAGVGCLLTVPAVIDAPQAYAQSSTSVTVGPGGVTVRERDRHRDRRHWRRDRDRCTTVIERTRRNGRVFERRVRRCR